MFRCLFNVVKLFIFGSAVVFAIQYSLARGSFVFSPKRIKMLAEKYARQPVGEMTAKLDRDLSAIYGDEVNIPTLANFFQPAAAAGRQPHKKPGPAPWLPFNGGGMVGQFRLYHVSLIEYLALVSIPTRTVGSVGLMWMNHSCSVIDGGVTNLNGFTKEVHGPGEHFRLSQFETYTFEVNDHASMLCYGRGFTPTALPYAVFGVLSSGDPAAAFMILLTVCLSLARVFWTSIKVYSFRLLRLLKIV